MALRLEVIDDPLFQGNPLRKEEGKKDLFRRTQYGQVLAHNWLTKEAVLLQELFNVLKPRAGLPDAKKLLLLIDESSDKVVAGATMEINPKMKVDPEEEPKPAEQSRISAIGKRVKNAVFGAPKPKAITIKPIEYATMFLDDVHLPANLSDKKIGVLTKLAIDKDYAGLLPGVKLQEEILKSFQNGDLGVDVLASYVLSPDTMSLYKAHEGVNTDNLHVVVKPTLTLDAAAKYKSWFVAASRDKNTLLITGGSTPLSITGLKEMAHEAYTSDSAAHRERLRINREQKAGKNSPVPPG